MTLDEIQEYALGLAKKARSASARVRTVNADIRNKVLFEVANSLRANEKIILEENAKDLAAFKDKISPAKYDRLTLNHERLEGIAVGVEQIASFADPLGKILEKRKLENGVDISRVSVPLGCVFFIYESRPNVTIDGAALCFKAGIVGSLLKMRDYLDLVIPRGGENLIRAVTDQSSIPVIKHFNGICHIYVDKSADIDMAAKIVENAKTQRCGTCNTVETLLLNRDLSDADINRILDPLRAKKVEFFGDKETQARLADVKDFEDEDGYHHEYLAFKLSIRFVKNVEEACDHIEKYSSRHTESVIASDKAVQEYFLANVDSSSVMVNASTRLADGGVYGLGAEVGISTDKIHARGPMGLEELCTSKYVILGNGQIR